MDLLIRFICSCSDLRVAVGIDAALWHRRLDSGTCLAYERSLWLIVFHAYHLLPSWFLSAKKAQIASADVLRSEKLCGQQFMVEELEAVDGLFRAANPGRNRAPFQRVNGERRKKELRVHRPEAGVPAWRPTHPLHTRLP